MNILIFFSSFALATLLVAFAIRICRQFGWVAVPRADRWHKGTPAFYGGVPIWLTFVFAAVVFLPWAAHLQWKLVGIASCMFVLGLVDDIVHLRPAPKFLAQIIAAGLAVGCGLVYPVRESYIVNAVISVIWIVGITNAFNLLDNMDGLSAGIAFISALYLALFFIAAGAMVNGLLPILLAGAIAGFLIFNFYPAKIFMGDGGSLFIGFLLACTSLLGVTHISGVPALVFTPITVLAIPIFDTLFVSVTRRLRGQPVSVGGTDHSSHRLVEFGLHERSAVLLLYTLAAASGSIALVLRHIPYKDSIALLGLWFLFLLLFGIYLFRTNVPSHSKKALGVLNHLDHAALIIDPLVLSLAYYLGFFLVFRNSNSPNYVSLFLLSWPIVVGVQVISLHLWKVYRSSWWRGSMVNAYRLIGAIISGTIFSILFLMGLHRTYGNSHNVFLIDAIFSWVLLLTMRTSFSLFKGVLQSLESRTAPGRRVFILGTSEHTHAAIQFLKGQGIHCVGLIDTNGGGDLGRLVWGKRVLGRVTDLSKLALEHRTCEIVLPENESIPCSEIELMNRCSRENLQFIKLGLYAPLETGEDNSFSQEKAKSTMVGSL
ncbi:MAG TPA: hypothetical protein VGF44_13965 [Terriglobales bacterium]|jgi:UDP-GlcNAc:undecaprenyl-phosphate GlcNAc-1-phosphate transferase